VIFSGADMPGTSRIQAAPAQPRQLSPARTFAPRTASAPANDDDVAPSEPEPSEPDPPEPSPDPEPPSRPDRDLPLLLGPMRAYACYDRAALARFCAGLSPGERLRARAMLAVLEGRARERDQPPEPWLRPAADAIDGLEAG
jgi:hypothetical protein